MLTRAVVPAILVFTIMSFLSKLHVSGARSRFMVSAASFVSSSPPQSSLKRTAVTSVSALTSRYQTVSSSSSFQKKKTLLKSSNQREDEFSTSNWMDKNNEFTRYDTIPGGNAGGGGGNTRKNTDKQRRRRNDKRKKDFNERQNENFRDNFRGTRVFVQGIPTHASWQDLKDHFKVAGDVVFASVSIDPSTGVSKGCGVVQYESTEMAENAMKVMRDHPMDGNSLFVREDVQENKNGRELGDRRGGSGGGGGTDYGYGNGRSTPPTKWRCADDANLSLLSEDDQLTVRNLIKARDQARRRKNYETSDHIREDLKTKYSVHLDDRLKSWWVSTDNAVPKAVSDAKGDGRWGKQNPWRQIPTTFENDASVNPDLVNGLLAQRDIARREKDFTTADMLLEEARTAPDGDLNLRIHDESRTWRIWTAEKPRLNVVSHEPYEPRQAVSPVQRSSPAEQCISLVTRHDPSKVNEVKKLLEKFPGREYNILKKLRQKYIK